MGHQRAVGGGREVVSGRRADDRPAFGPTDKIVAGIRRRCDRDRGSTVIGPVAAGYPTRRRRRTRRDRVCGRWRYWGNDHADRGRSVASATTANCANTVVV